MCTVSGFLPTATGAGQNNQVGSVRTGNDENQTGSGEKDEEDRTRVGSKLVAQQFGVNCVVALYR